VTFVRTAFGLLRTFARPLLVMYLVYFSLIGVGMAYGAWDRETHETITSGIRGQVPKSLPHVFSAYTEGRFAAAVALTFVINFVAGSFLTIAAPSFVVPFSGLLLGGFRAVLWGFIFVPDFSEPSGAGWVRGALIGGLLLLEGQGYVLAMWAAYVQGRTFLFPASAGAVGHWQGYKLGVARSLQLYLFVAVALAVAAVYEATLVIVLFPLLK
jgi:hypothetical protein